jgi:hypothetical protein
MKLTRLFVPNGLVRSSRQATQATRLLTRRWQAIVGGNLVCRVGELKANSYHFIQTKKAAIWRLF